MDSRAIYDTYGEYGLKEGVVTPEGSKLTEDSVMKLTLICWNSEKIGGGYFMRMASERFFDKYFGDTNPW